MDGSKRAAEFVCASHVMERIIVADYIDGNPVFNQAWNEVVAHATITLSNGSLWTVWTDFPSSFAYDLYRDAEWTSGVIE